MYDTAIKNGQVHQQSFKNQDFHDFFLETLFWINICPEEMQWGLLPCMFTGKYTYTCAINITGRYHESLLRDNDPCCCSRKTKLIYSCY